MSDGPSVVPEQVEEDVISGHKDDDGLPTHSSIEQSAVEKTVRFLYDDFADAVRGKVPFLRDNHIAYLKKGIRHLAEYFECLDASQPWLCYWILHSLSLLDSPVSRDLALDIVQFLSQCQSPQGGFGGGPGQLPHLAPTYAAVLSLCTLGIPEALAVIDRPGLQLFLLCMHQEDGSYTMHEDGEKDIRGVYCGLVSALLTNVICPELTAGTVEWLLSCQTYEGGFSAVPGAEAHGGYTFCGFAALVLLNSDLCDLHTLLRWVARKQMKFEGGFQGRTNKLVDGCYSFWQGGVFPLLYMALREKHEEALHPELWQFDQEALQQYILCCCQTPHGGLRDKPGKSKDFYHTCYCLSGLSVSQHCFANKRIINISANESAVLNPIHPVFNITLDKVQMAHGYFSKLSVPLLLQATGEETSGER